MRNVFVCSLCHNGILGGAIYLEHGSVTYRTQKLTVSEKYRNLVMPIKDIKEITWQQAVFPVATFHMRNGDEFKFIIFNRSRFIRCFEESMMG